MNTKLIQLRHDLHKHPELSNQEYQTAKRLENYINPFEPYEVLPVGSTGRLFVFKGKEKGKTSIFRTDMDAIPTQEKNQLSYQSSSDGIMHACGHDGHMTILCGLAQYISTNLPQKGTVILLFQPAEECEQGAKDVVNHHNFIQYKPDYIFGLHNIPGEEKNKILIKDGSFTAASKGMSIFLQGKSSHAAEPDLGNSPASAISKLISTFHQIIAKKEQFSALTLLTIVHIKMGEIAFGTNPGDAEIHLTLRAFENDDMTKLTQLVELNLDQICKKENLSYHFTYCEEFPATVNHPKAVQLIREAALKKKLSIETIKFPYKWSEDFAYYTQKYEGAFFGLGAGKNHAALHHNNYDFPDDILQTGIDLFSEIYHSIHF